MGHATRRPRRIAARALLWLAVGLSGFLIGCASIGPWDAATLSRRNMQFREVAAFSSSIDIVKQIETGRLGGRAGGRATACTACSQ